MVQLHSDDVIGKIESSSIKENKDSFNLWFSLAKREITSQTGNNNTLTKNPSTSNIQNSKAEEDRDLPSPRSVATPLLANTSLTQSEQMRRERKFPFSLLNVTNYLKMDTVTQQPLAVLLVAGNFWMLIMLYLFGFVGFMLIILLTMNIYLGLRLVEVEHRVSALEKKLPKQS